MSRRSLSRPLAAGLAASLAMAILAFLAGSIGVPYLNWTEALSANQVFGYLLFLGLGISVAMVFRIFFHDYLPGQSWQRGFLFAVMMWILTGAALAPLLGMGFFMGSVVASLGTLLTYLCYGGVLGYLCDV
jgi:hypothetical protein